MTHENPRSPKRLSEKFSLDIKAAYAIFVLLERTLEAERVQLLKN